MAQRVQIVQMPDGTWVQQLVEETSITNINQEILVQPQAQAQPMPPPQPGLWTSIKGTFNGDMRWNPVTRRYEYVELNRPERTGWRRRLWGR